jgi:hypothetical protein
MGGISCSTGTCGMLPCRTLRRSGSAGLIAEDDEAYTYHKRINRLATVQEHFMVVRAIELGVSEDKLAKTLDLDIKAIQRRRTPAGWHLAQRSSSC